MSCKIWYLVNPLIPPLGTSPTLDTDTISPLEVPEDFESCSSPSPLEGLCKKGDADRANEVDRCGNVDVIEVMGGDDDRDVITTELVEAI